jgi:hypothetical protein
MFVRYRKIVADGHQPRGVHAKIACQGRCAAHPGRYGFRGRRAGQCPVKPRCRWRIGLGAVDTAIAIHIPAPYRLQVQLVENRRVEGKVRQELTSISCSVDGHLLPEFWRGVDPAFAATIKKASVDGHRWLSVEVGFDPALVARTPRQIGTCFGCGTGSVLGSGLPRLDRPGKPARSESLRMVIHQRIPWPMQAERDRAEARSDFAFWKAAHDGQIKHIEGHEKVIATANKEITEARANVPRNGRRLDRRRLAGSQGLIATA